MASIQRIDYRFCAVENDRVTFVNGKWNGKLPRDTEPREKAMKSCPLVWEFLQRAGDGGWDLAAALPWALASVDDIRGKPKNRSRFATALILKR